jgi:proteic killer suppression protein
MLAGYVIQDFADRATEDVYHGVDSRPARQIPRALWAIVRRKLDALDAAKDVKDLRSPPGNRLEKLSGTLRGMWSIRVNDQFRIVFRFDAGVASGVRVVDYH